MKSDRRVVIFLGPTISPDEARQILEATYLPPARCCDFISAITRYQPEIIGIIDGVFDQSPPVRHKEIMYALNLGIQVYGASSMGALRAAETDAYGMIGVGEIYRMYAQGELEDDDEVALLHALESMEYRQLSEPMVNLRQTFKLAFIQGLINEEIYQQLIAIAKGIYYQQRTLTTIFQKALAIGISPETIDTLTQFTKENYVDIKRQDAILLLETIRDLPDPLANSSQNFDFVSTPAFKSFYNLYRKVNHRGMDIPLSTIYEHVALNTPDFMDLKNQALNRKLVLILGELLEIQVSPEDLDAQTKRFRLKYQLVADETFTTWLVNNDLTIEEFQSLMHESALCNYLHKWLSNRRDVKTLLLNELRLQNRYESLAGETASKARILQDYHPYLEEMAHEGSKTEYLFINHMYHTKQYPEINYREWLAEAGFPDAFSLRMELLRSKLARETIENIALGAAQLFAPEEV